MPELLSVCFARNFDHAIAPCVVRQALDVDTQRRQRSHVTGKRIPVRVRGTSHIMVGSVRNLAAHCPIRRAGQKTARIAQKLQRGDAIHAGD